MSNFAEQGVVKPSTVLFKFRINPKKMDIFAKLGIPQFQRDEEALADKQWENGIKGTERIDAAGLIRKDSGKQLFKYEKISARVHCSLYTLEDSGYVVEKLYMYKKRDDRMGWLVIVLTDNKEKGKGIEEYLEILKNQKPELHQKIEVITELVYGHVYVWINPDATMTINCSHIENEAKKVDLLVSINETEIECQLVQ